MKKILLTLVIGLVLVTGCFGKTSKYSKSIELTFDKYEEKIEKKKSFVMLIWRTGCPHCEDFEPKLNEIIKDNDLLVYSINLTGLTDEQSAKLKNKTFVTGTPTLVVFKDGKYQAKLVGNKSEEEVIEFLEENEYIR